MLLLLLMHSFLTGQLTSLFTDTTIEPFTQNSGPCLPENFDVSVATALDYFNLLFKPKIFSDIKTTQTIMPSSKKKIFWRNRNNPDYVDSVWQETIVEELKALSGAKMTSLAIVE